MMKKCQKINLQEPQRNRNANAFFVNLIRTKSTVSSLERPCCTNAHLWHCTCSEMLDGEPGDPGSSPDSGPYLSGYFTL